MRYCTAAKITETFLLPSPNSSVDGFVSNLTLGYYIWLYGYRYIRAFYEPGRVKYLCIYNHITKYNSQVFLNTALQQAAAIQSNMQTRFQTEWFYIIYSRCVPYFSKHVSIFDFPRKRRCLYFTLSFTHLLRLKHQWFTVLNTCRI